MKDYKEFNHDMTCRAFQEDKTYKIDEEHEHTVSLVLEGIGSKIFEYNTITKRFDMYLINEFI